MNRIRSTIGTRLLVAASVVAIASAAVGGLAVAAIDPAINRAGAAPVAGVVIQIGRAHV